MQLPTFCLCPLRCLGICSLPHCTPVCIVHAQCRPNESTGCLAASRHGSHKYACILLICHPGQVSTCAQSHAHDSRAVRIQLFLATSATTRLPPQTPSTCAHIFVASPAVCMYVWPAKAAGAGEGGIGVRQGGLGWVRGEEVEGPI